MSDAAPTAADRTLSAFRALLLAELPSLLFQGVWEYSVERADDKTFDGNPTSTTIPLPPLVGIPYRPGLAGATCVPKVGSLVYVSFANGDTSKPIVVAFSPTPPESVTLDATGTASLGPNASAVNLGSGSDLVPFGEEFGRVVRYGDEVQIAVVGAAAVGIISQSFTSAPNPISKVHA